MSKPIAVLISDVHYNLANLKLADAAMRMAVAKANELCVPLIVAGDLHDTKANLRGECVKAMREVMRLANERPYVVIGNHDRINEKSTEHSLHCLGRLVRLISKGPGLIYHSDGEIITMIPYQHDPMEFVRLAGNHRNRIIIAHQGVQGSNMGDYFQDKSAVQADLVAGMRIISGHYHARQTIDLTNGGKWDYIGSPYTMSFGEANDPPKGFQILMYDGSLEFVPTSLRKHIVIDFNVLDFDPYEYGSAGADEGDLIWIKLKGTKEELSKITRDYVSKYFNVKDFRLDLIPNPPETGKNTPEIGKLVGHALLDNLIESLTATSDDCKIRLKDKWKALCK